LEARLKKITPTAKTIEPLLVHLKDNTRAAAAAAKHQPSVTLNKIYTSPPKQSNNRNHPLAPHLHASNGGLPPRQLILAYYYAH
jgi:hypothetical protein